MIRLWIRPDGSFIETVYAREDPAAVAEANAKLAERWGDLATEDLSNDAYEAMKPRRADGTVDDRRERWRRRGAAIIVDEAAPDQPHPRQALLDEVRGATSVADLRAILERLVRGE